MIKYLTVFLLIGMVFWRCEDEPETHLKLWGVSYSIEDTDTLRLANKSLTGEIPLEIGDLVNLTHLYLNNNQLSGSIPKEIGNLKKLKVLYLNRNVLTGEIPTEIGNLTNLTELWLSNNNLTGTIPSEIGNLNSPYFTWLYLDNNQLEGQIPESICDMNLGASFNFYWNNLCPPYPTCIMEPYDFVGQQDTTDCD